ncbi:MAG: hypothetical protein MJZ15_01185 [Bacteroidales bacterium]|nr:hypothetical protein [Bacteroidales bacterium]
MNTLFTIDSKTLTDSGATFTVSIDGNHRVFEGHFPGNPVLPGVMSMLIVRKCAEDILGIKSHFASIKDIKYLQTIIPDGRPLTVNVSCSEKVVSADIISADNIPLMKMKGTLA